VFLLRLLLQWARADFRNPLSQAIVRLSNWLIMPLRRMLPPVGRVDTASVVAVVLVALAKVAALQLVAGYGVPDAIGWLRAGGVAALLLALVVGGRAWLAGRRPAAA